MNEFGRLVNIPVDVFFTGGATAVLLDVREMTADIDLKFDPDPNEVYIALQELKKTLNLNIELVSPADFVPALPNWRERSLFIAKHGQVSFYHFDLYTQVLSKLARGWENDERDVRAYCKNAVDLNELLKLVEEIRNEFARFPRVEFEVVKSKITKLINDQ